ncbi:hypothetical protein BWU74_18185 [Paraburkholderia caledonica]|nr:hypothetical protein BWU74_18185 [Burkholderia sp. Bk]
MTLHSTIPAALQDKISQAAATALDPDYKRYPHLFKVYKLTDEEICKHQAQTISNQCEAKPGEPQANALPDELEPARYVPVSGVFKIVPKTRLKQAGWKKVASAVHYSQPTEFLDTNTGKVLTNRDVFMRSINVGIGYSISERYIESLVTFNNCTAKELPFIRFILCARNRRGGLIMDVRDLIDIWLGLEGIQVRSTDRARKRRSMVNMLKKRKILANDTTLSPHFQLRAKVSRREAVQEETEIVRLVVPAAKPGHSLEERYGHLNSRTAQ